jgi:hypothetical protein
LPPYPPGLAPLPPSPYPPNKAPRSPPPKEFDDDDETDDDNDDDTGLAVGLGIGIGVFLGSLALIGIMLIGGCCSGIFVAGAAAADNDCDKYNPHDDGTDKFREWAEECEKNGKASADKTVSKGTKASYDHNPKQLLLFKFPNGL